MHVSTMNRCNKCGLIQSKADASFSDWCKKCLVEMMNEDDFLDKYRVMKDMTRELSDDDTIPEKMIPIEPLFRRVNLDGDDYMISRKEDGEYIVFRLASVK